MPEAIPLFATPHTPILRYATDVASSREVKEADYILCGARTSNENSPAFRLAVTWFV